MISWGSERMRHRYTRFKSIIRQLVSQKKLAFFEPWSVIRSVQDSFFITYFKLSLLVTKFQAETGYERRRNDSDANRQVAAETDAENSRES